MTIPLLHIVGTVCPDRVTNSFQFSWDWFSVLRVLYSVFVIVALTQGLALARKWSCTWANPRPFCFSYFSNRISCLRLGWLDLQSPYLSLLQSWGDRCVPPCPDFICWDVFSWTHSPGCLQTIIRSYLYLPYMHPGFKTESLAFWELSSLRQTGTVSHATCARGSMTESPLRL
jgi:hypothetical protein